MEIGTLQYLIAKEDSNGQICIYAKKIDADTEKR
ncbi:hypothetical protein CDIMF43_280054 [Carnobacterium divergens]|nr:hypothetical protein CDIMF43_280054 [Carnobacterium divergens]